MSIVLHFNHFTGKLMGGYLRSNVSGKKVGMFMTRIEVLAYLTNNPDVACDPLKV